MAQNGPKMAQMRKSGIFRFNFSWGACDHSYASIHVLTFCSGHYGTNLIQGSRPLLDLTGWYAPHTHELSRVDPCAVSYTPLTLPTNREVSISVVAVSLKKKKKKKTKKQKNKKKKQKNNNTKLSRVLRH